MKHSSQRDLILETLQENPCHPTAEKLFELVRQKNKSISLATVYRNLHLLAENGVIRKLDNLENMAHFDHNVHKHYHFICSKCSRIIDISPEIIADLEQRLLRENGLKLDSISISFRGICQDCQKT